MRQFVTYLLVGALNTLFGYSTFAVFLLLGLHYAVAALLSTILGVLFNFHTIGRLVFGKRDPSLIVRFLGVYGVTYLLNVGALRLLHAEIEVLVAQAALVLPLAGVSFLMHQRLVFGREAVRP